MKVLPYGPADDHYNPQDFPIKVWKSTQTYSSRFQLWHGVQFSVAGIELQLHIRRQSPQATVIVDMELDDAFGLEGAKVDEHQPAMTLSVQTPKGKAGEDWVIDETPTHSNPNLFGAVAREAYQLSQGSQQEPEDSTKASVLSLIRSVGDGSESARLVSPKSTAMPRFTAIANLDTSEAVDSQNSTSRDADTLLTFGGPVFTSSPPSELAAAEDVVQVDMEDAPASLHAESPLAAQSANGLVECTTTTVSNNNEEAEETKNGSQSPPAANICKKGNVLEDGEPPHAKNVKQSGTCNKKPKHSLNEQVGAENELQSSMDDTPALLHVKSPLTAQGADGTVEPTTTAVSKNIEEVEDPQNESGSLPTTNRRKRGNTLEDGTILHDKNIKQLGTRQRKARNSLSEQAAAKNELQVNAEDAPRLSPVESALKAQNKNDTVEATATPASNNVEEAEVAQSGSESPPKAKRRRKANTLEGEEATHTENIEKAGTRKRKPKNSLGKARLGNSQESMESTIEVQVEPPARDLLGHKESKSFLGESCEDPPSSSSLHHRRRSSKEASPPVAKATTKEIKVLFGSTTDIFDSEAYKTPMTKAGIRRVLSVSECDYLCVGKGELKKTAKVISAIASGKPIVTEDWAKECATVRRLLEPAPYLASHPRHKREWGITLAEAIELGKQGLKPLADYLVLITPALKKQLGSAFEEVKQIAEIGGATKVTARPPTSRDQQSTTLVVATDDDPRLVQLLQDRWRCYTKDLITMSVLRSALDLESDEFLIGKEADVAGNRQGFRSRKRQR